MTRAIRSWLWAMNQSRWTSTRSSAGGQNIRINTGAYGGTAEASMAQPSWALLCDLDNSGIVDLSDITSMAAEWLQSGPNLPPDVSRDGTFNIEDFALLTQDWLKQPFGTKIMFLVSKNLCEARSNKQSIP